MRFATSFVYVVAVTNTQGPLGMYMYVQINNKDTRFMSHWLFQKTRL